LGHAGFESACGDGVPIFNLARHCLPACKVLKFEAILNTTTNVILQEMEVNDVTMEEGLKRAQEMGIAEADPSGDIDGYDAAVKCICLARVLMGANRPESIEGVHRDSLRVVSLAEVRSTLPNRIKFVCTGQINEATSTVELAVRKTVVSPQDFMLYNVCGADNVWRFEFDNLCPITLVQHNGTTRDTGYGLLADLLDVLGYCERP
jgi:homoserine dehydrogenase